MAKGHRKFKMEYGQQLVEHMKKGYSLRSFAAISEIPYSTLQYWIQHNKNFQKFAELGESLSQHYWETIGIAGAQGQLQRVKEERVMKTSFLDEMGRPVKDATGKPMIKEEVVFRSYEPTGLKDSMWKFVMGSRFGWHDKQDPASLDPEKAGPAQTLKKFQLGYNLEDKPYVVKERPPLADPTERNEKAEEFAACGPGPDGQELQPGELPEGGPTDG